MKRNFNALKQESNSIFGSLKIICAQFLICVLFLLFSAITTSAQIPWNDFVSQYQNAVTGSTITLSQNILALAGVDETPFASPLWDNFTIDGAGYIMDSSSLAGKGI